MSELLTLSDNFDLSMLNWGIAFSSAFLIGFSKAGIKGIGVVFVTLMVLVFGGKISTGIIIPLLIVADILAVIYYNRSADWSLLFKLLPWVLIGIFIGMYVGKDMPEVVFKRGMAVIILLTVVMMFWWERKKDMEIPDNFWFAGVMGLGAGFTTMVGNLAGAFSNIFFLAMRVPKQIFIGTAAWLFFIVNIVKLPIHVFVWETLSIETFAVIIRLIPCVFFGFFVGVRLVERIQEKTYRKMILILTAFGAVMIFLR